MERRGSGMKKIIGEYKRFENLENYHAPEFNSNASEFHVTMWNLKYGIDVIKQCLFTRCLHQIRHTSLNSKVCICQFGKGKYTFIAYCSCPLMSRLIACSRFGKGCKCTAESIVKFILCQIERQTNSIPCTIFVNQFRTMHIDINLTVKSTLRSQVFYTTLFIIFIKINLVYLKEIALQYNEF